MAAQLLHRFAPSEQITPSLLNRFTPLGSPTLTSFFQLWTNYPSLLHHFTPPWQANSYFILPPLKKYPLNLTPFWRPWQPNNYNILTPMNKKPPHSYPISPPLETQLCYHFTPFAAPLLPHFISSEQITPLILATLNPPWQPSCYIFLPPLSKLTPHSYTIFSPWQPNSYIVLPLWTMYPSFLHHFTPLGSPTLTSFYLL